MKPIKRVKLEVDDLSNPDLLAHGRHVETKLNEGTTFDTLDAKVTQLGGVLTALEARINAVNDKETELEQAQVALDQQRAEAINVLASLGAGVESIAAGETTIMVASGFELHAERAPIGPLAAPQNVRAAFADHAGQVICRWGGVRGARSYIVECAPENGGDWKHAGVTTKVSFTLTGLESGKKYRVRVCAIGAAGQGPWSDEAVKMAA